MPKLIINIPDDDYRILKSAKCYRTNTLEKAVINGIVLPACEDVISREKANEAIQDVFIPYIPRLWGEIEKLPLKCARALIDLPSVQPKQSWIPVSERLPGEDGEYLITWTTSQSKRQFIGISEGEITSEYDHEFKFEWLLEDYIKAYRDVEVIAWMPLPKPYKGE